MQAIIYRLSFYNTEVLTKGGSGGGPLFLFTRNRKGILVKQDTLCKLSPYPFHPPTPSPTLMVTCQAGYSDVLQPNTVNGRDLCSTMQLQNITYFKHNANRTNHQF